MAEARQGGAGGSGGAKAGRRDFYEVLGVPRDAASDAIKQAYRKQARLNHPDLSRAPDAEARMSAVNEAYEVLSDPVRRAAYDLALGQGVAGDVGEGWTSATGPASPSRAGPGRAGAAGPGAGPGAWGGPDLLVDEVDLDDGAAERAGWLDRLRQAGAGEDRHARVRLGMGELWRGGSRQVTLRRTAGGGAVEHRTLEVRFPPGLRPGQRLRLAGQGGPGRLGRAAGDLFLEVQLRPEGRFWFDPAGVPGGVGVLVVDLPVSPWEAALGGVVSLGLPDGRPIKVRVPAGAQSGQRLRVPARGWPGPVPGDLELAVRIVQPEAAADPAARALYERMARELAAFDPRKVPPPAA